MKFAQRSGGNIENIASAVREQRECQPASLDSVTEYIKYAACNLQPQKLHRGFVLLRPVRHIYKRSNSMQLNNTSPISPGKTINIKHYTLFIVFLPCAFSALCKGM